MDQLNHATQPLDYDGFVKALEAAEWGVFRDGDTLYVARSNREMKLDLSDVAQATGIMKHPEMDGEIEFNAATGGDFANLLAEINGADGNMTVDYSMMVNGYRPDLEFDNPFPGKANLVAQLGAEFVEKHLSGVDIEYDGVGEFEFSASVPGVERYVVSMWGDIDSDGAVGAITETFYEGHVVLEGRESVSYSSIAEAAKDWAFESKCAIEDSSNDLDELLAKRAAANRPVTSTEVTEAFASAGWAAYSGRALDTDTFIDFNKTLTDDGDGPYALVNVHDMSALRDGVPESARFSPSVEFYTDGDRSAEYSRVDSERGFATAQEALDAGLALAEENEPVFMANIGYALNPTGRWEQETPVPKRFEAAMNELGDSGTFQGWAVSDGSTPESVVFERDGGTYAISLSRGAEDYCAEARVYGVAREAHFALDPFDAVQAALFDILDAEQLFTKIAVLGVSVQGARADISAKISCENYLVKALLDNAHKVSGFNPVKGEKNGVVAALNALGNLGPDAATRFTALSDEAIGRALESKAFAKAGKTQDTGR